MGLPVISQDHRHKSPECIKFPHMTEIAKRGPPEIPVVENPEKSHEIGFLQSRAVWAVGNENKYEEASQ